MVDEKKGEIDELAFRGSGLSDYFRAAIQAYEDARQKGPPVPQQYLIKGLCPDEQWSYDGLRSWMMNRTIPDEVGGFIAGSLTIIERLAEEMQFIKSGDMSPGIEKRRYEDALRIIVAKIGVTDFERAFAEAQTIAKQAMGPE